MVNIKTYSYSIGLIFILLMFFGCGGDGSHGTDSNAGDGSIGFGLAWESPDSSSMSKSTVYRAASIDVCTDYGITTINAYVINSSNSTVTSGSWACSEHGGSHTSVPAGSNYTLRVEAVVSGAVKWRGEVTGISIITEQTTNIGQITMTYIGSDSTPPTVSSTSPASNATSVPVNSTVTASFSEKIAPSSLDTTTFTLSNGPNQINGTVSYDQSSMTATFTPINPLSYATTYTASLTSGVKDMAGNNLQPVYTWTFTTGSTPDTTPPTVSSTSPANIATNVAVNTTITATFSETMDASTVSATTFTLNNGVTGTVAYSGTTVTFTPSSNLAYSTTYTATISTGVKDAAGNAMAAAYTWTFTTGAAAAPTITSVSPNPVTGSNSPQTITINGTNFVNKPTVAVTWTGDGTILSSSQVTFVSSTQLQMSITTQLTADTWTVKVTNPDGQVSNTASFIVQTPSVSAPTISSMSPNPVTGSNSPQTITINGTNFVNKPTVAVTWTGGGSTLSATQVTFVSSTQLQMSITTQLTSDTWTVKVTNPDNQESNIASFTVQGSVASAPTGVSATAGNGLATISWSSVPGATSYNIYWSTTSGVTKTSGTKLTNVTPGTHTGLTNGTTYYYVVTAMNSYGESVESSQVSATPQLTTAAPGKMPDTNQTTSYTTTFGEDHNYTINPPSYTDNGNGTITDNVNGLVWQKQDDATKRTWADAGTYCDASTLGGYSDWRLPSLIELISIIDNGAYNPSINTAFFPGTFSSSYWSSTTRAYYTSYAWNVYFSYGGSSGSEGKTYLEYVRCVRGGQTTPSLTDNGNGTVTDSGTHLIWQQGESSVMTWEAALTYCEGLSLAAQTDWRLPNHKELLSLVDYTRYNPSINTTFFPSAISSGYWSSTTYAYSTSYAWYVYFNYGYSNSGVFYGKTNSNYVRCVRGGQ